MGLLNWDDKELDMRGSRIAINTDLAAKRGGLWVYLAQGSSNTHITDDGTLQYTSYATLNGKNDDVQKLLADGIINNLTCSRLSLINIPIISSDVIPSNIYCSSLRVCRSGALKNLNICVSGSNSDRYQYFQNMVGSSNHDVHFQDELNSCSFENVNINFNGVPQPTISFYLKQFVDLNGLRSNTQVLHQYIAKGYLDECMKLFKPGNCHVYDTQKGADVLIPVKNLKKAIAIANNEKRYKLHSYILELAPNAKVSDLYPTNVLKDLHTIIIRNDNVALLLVKEGSVNARPWSMSRTPSPSFISKDLDKMYQKTADGWYVIWKQQN